MLPHKQIQQKEAKLNAGLISPSHTIYKNIMYRQSEYSLNIACMKQPCGTFTETIILIAWHAL